MSPAELTVLHITHVSAVLVLIGYTFFAFAGAPETRKRVLMITGVALLGTVAALAARFAHLLQEIVRDPRRPPPGVEAVRGQVACVARIVERADVKTLFANPQHPYTIGLLGSLLLGLFATQAEVGYFASAEKISKAAFGLLNPIREALYPRLSNMVQASRQSAVRLARIGIVVMVAGGLVLLAFVRALNAAKVTTTMDILFVGNVGEEGLGDLRGTKFLFTKGKYKDRIRMFISADGTDPGNEIVSGAVGSKRYRVTFKGPGGHSYSAFGLVSPAFAMANAAAKLGAVTVPASPKTTFNVGVVGGGTSVNSIPGEMWMEVDMRSESKAELDKVDAAFKTVEEHFGGNVEVLVSNAGITKDTLLLRMSETDFASVLDANLTGGFRVAKRAVKSMMRKRYGRIVFVSSVVGLVGQAGQANYAASKAGLVGFARSLARELGSRSITVNVVAPGPVETDMTASMIEKLEGIVPIGRVGQAREIAGLVSFLAGRDGGYATGASLTIDGGFVL